MIITRRVPCKNCSTPIMRNHATGMFSYNHTGYCRKCARKLYRTDLRKKQRIKRGTAKTGKTIDRKRAVDRK
jgi:hypothetical protein